MSSLSGKIALSGAAGCCWILLPSYAQLTRILIEPAANSNLDVVRLRRAFMILQKTSQR